MGLAEGCYIPSTRGTLISLFIGQYNARFSPVIVMVMFPQEIQDNQEIEIFP